jgi:creatinine amidohydrolase
MSHLQRLPEDEFRFGYLSPSELKARLQQKAILYLPIGSLEWHNEHLPLGTDTLLAIELAARLCRHVGGVVLPGIWWNTGDCHNAYCTYHMPEAYYRAALKMVCTGLRPIPARLLVLVNGHGGGYQKESMPLIADELNQEGFPMKAVVADAYTLGLNAACRIDHAATGETSFALAMIPQLVRMEREITPDIYSQKWPFAAKGEPSAEFGNTLWEAVLSEARVLLESEYTAAGGISHTSL